MEEGETDEKTFFICEICSEMFNDKAGLESHHQDKHAIKTFKCAVCVTYFEKHEHLLEHMQNHVAVFLFKCQNCGKTFSNITDLRLHMEDHVVLKKYFCCLCTDKFGNIDIFQLHLKKIHDIKPKPKKNRKPTGTGTAGVDNVVASKDFKCEFCDADFENDQLLFSHVKDHAKNEKNAKLAPNVLLIEPNINFKIAEVASVSSSSLSSNAPVLLPDQNTNSIHQVPPNRVIIVQKTDQGNFACQLCQKTFTFQENLLLHLKTHPIVEGIQPVVQTIAFQNPSKPYRYEKDQYPCLKCNESFAFEENLHLHLKTHSEGETSPNSDKKSMMQCDECGIFILDPQEFALHLEMHQDFKCATCGEEFSDPLEFDNHERTHLLSALTCYTCKEQFPSKDSLNLHRKIRHEKKTLMCGVCGDVLSNDELKNHMKTHLKSPKTEKCNICNETVLKSRFDAHMEMHEITDFYYCDVCDDEFDGEEEFQIHLSSHFICKICKKLFNFQSQLDQHLLSHNQKCKICELKFESEKQLQEHSKTHDDEPKSATFQESPTKDKRNLEEHDTIQPGEEMAVLAVAGGSYINSTTVSHDHGGLVSKNHQGNRLQPETPSNDASKEAKMHDESQTEQSVTDKPTTGGVPFRSKITCDYCPRRFRFALAYENHLKDHPKKCQDCGQIFRRLDQLRAHELSDHPQKRKTGPLPPHFILYLCNLCSMEFQTEHELIEHQITHTLPNGSNGKSLATSSQTNNPAKSKISEGLELVKKGPRPTYYILYLCNLCSMEFESEGELTEHKLTHTLSNDSNGNKLKTSSQTNKPDKSKEKKEQYKKEESEDIAEDLELVAKKVRSQSIKCHLCHQEMADGSDLKEHMESVHNYVCDSCDMSFNSITELNRHQCTHSAPEVLRCSYNECDVKFETEEEMNEHVESHHAVPSPLSHGIRILPNSVKTLNCSVSETNEPMDTSTHDEKQTIASEVEDPNIHEEQDEANIIEIEPLNAEETLTCELCSTSVFSETEMQHHMEALHKNIRFRCDVCFILFSTRASYDSHRQRHFQKKDSFVCSAKRCGARFSSSEALGEHSQSHTLKREIKKSLSDAIHAKKRRSDTHKELKKPNRDKKFLICDVCDERFFSFEIQKFQLHEENHKLEDMNDTSKSKTQSMNSDVDEESNSVECDLCSLSMLDEKELKTHMNSAHKDIRFRCEVCSALLSTKPEFDRHKKTHMQQHTMVKRCSVRLKKLSSELL